MNPMKMKKKMIMDLKENNEHDCFQLQLFSFYNHHRSRCNNCPDCNHYFRCKDRKCNLLQFDFSDVFFRGLLSNLVKGVSFERRKKRNYFSKNSFQFHLSAFCQKGNVIA